MRPPPAMGSQTRAGRRRVTLGHWAWAPSLPAPSRVLQVASHLRPGQSRNGLYGKAPKAFAKDSRSTRERAGRRRRFGLWGHSKTADLVARWAAMNTWGCGTARPLRRVRPASVFRGAGRDGPVRRRYRSQGMRGKLPIGASTEHHSCLPGQTRAGVSCSIERRMPTAFRTATSVFSVGFPFGDSAR